MDEPRRRRRDVALRRDLEHHARFTDGQYDLRVVTTDKSGNTFTSAAVLAEVQNAAPTATAVQLLDGGGTAGRAEQGDRIVATFSQTLRVSTMCSTWSGDFTDQSLAALGDVTVTITDGGVANDTLTVTSASCTFHFGTHQPRVDGLRDRRHRHVLRIDDRRQVDHRLERDDAHARPSPSARARARAPPAPSRAARRRTRPTPRSGTASAPRSRGTFNTGILTLF